MVEGSINCMAHQQAGWYYSSDGGTTSSYGRHDFSRS